MLRGVGGLALGDEDARDGLGRRLGRRRLALVAPVAPRLRVVLGRAAARLHARRGELRQLGFAQRGHVCLMVIATRGRAARKRLPGLAETDERDCHHCADA